MSVTVAGVDVWRLAWEHSPIGMALVDFDGRAIDVNHALCAMFGYDAETFRISGFLTITHPDDLDESREIFGRVGRGEIDSIRLRKRYLHADGHVVWGDLSAVLVRAPDGSPLHVLSQFLDVSDQHAHEERLEAARAEAEREHQTLEAVFEAVGVGLLLVGPDGHYQRMNRRHRDGLRLPFPQGHPGQAGYVGHVYHLDGTTMFTREEMPSYRAGRGEEFDACTYWVGSDPSTRIAYSTSARQVRGPDGERLGAALAYQNITDLMRAQRAQDEFVSSVSHELRTPLTPVLGHLEMLCEHDGLPADVLDQLLVVRRNALRLGALLADLLHVGEIGEGGLQLQLSPTNLVAVVAEAKEALRPVAQSRGARITTEVPEQLWAVLDGLRVRQVLDNLLSNALKYGGDGGVAHVRLRTVPGAVELEVSDTGIGISPEDTERLFERFFRCDEAAARNIPGTGLGLHVVHSIVEAHGGTVTVESQPGHGSTFRVRLPHKPA